MVDSVAQLLRGRLSNCGYKPARIPLVLVDIVVANTDNDFTVDDFGQQVEGAFAQQAAYDEAVFSMDGVLLERRQGCADRVRNGRIVFYLHYYDPERPLRWTYGTVECPPVQLVPASLWESMPYKPVD